MPTFYFDYKLLDPSCLWYDRVYVFPEDNEPGFAVFRKGNLGLCLWERSEMLHIGAHEVSRETAIRLIGEDALKKHGL